MLNKPLVKLFIALLILVTIRLLRLDEVLTGDNFVGTAFFILLGLGIMFTSTEAKEVETRILRYEMHNLVHGSPEEKEEAKSYAYEHRMLLEGAKQEMVKKYGNSIVLPSKKGVK